MKNPFIQLASYIYSRRKTAVSKEKAVLVKKKLQQLYPLEDVEIHYKKYCINRMAAVFTVVFIGIVSAICLFLCSRNESSLAEGALLMRQEKGAGNYLVTLQARIGDWTEEIPLVVEERELTVQEKMAVIGRMPFLLPELMEFSRQPTPKESFFLTLQEELSKLMKENPAQKEVFLPQELKGKQIFWVEKASRDYLWIGALVLLGVFLVRRGMDREIEKEQTRRSRQLFMDYPGCVNKLRLYLSAGLTVRNAFFQITEDYKKQGSSRRHYLYEEMQAACYQLENGVMEERVYEEWGRRCGETRLKRLSFLLAVHVKKGNSQLLELLKEEAEGAREDRRGQARKLGEEAGTRLLFPMMLMLLIVMFLILLPAWADFGAM